jgi:hypothetical protein
MIPDNKSNQKWQEQQQKRNDDIERRTGMKFDASIGIPIPRLAYIPSSNSFAARRTIRSRMAAAVPGFAGS